MAISRALFVFIFHASGATSESLQGLVEVTECQPSWRKGQNFFGINLAFYKAHTDLFKVGSVIEVGDNSYFIDAMNVPHNCNEGVALVYVANKRECVDGTPWVYTSECGFGGTLLKTVEAGDLWDIQLEPVVTTWSCDTTVNFIAGARYTQTDLTSMCPHCSANPVYGLPNSNEKAVAYCKQKCEGQSTCLGFFYQRHLNGHEICGFYSSYEPIPSNARPSWDGHSSGSRICMKSSAQQGLRPRESTVHV